MRTLTQTGRFLEVTSDLGKDVLIPLYFNGKETISTLFDYTIGFISSKTNIKPEDLIGTAISLKIHGTGKESRSFYGIVKFFRAGKIKDDKRSYEIVIMPWLGMLQYEKNFRIFKKRTTQQILEEVFKDHGFHHFRFGKMMSIHPEREYCTQYGETTLQFVQRLMEEEGMFYYFEHTKEKHIMVIGDAFTLHTECPEPEIIYTGENDRGQRHYISSWERGYQFYSGEYRHTDYNYETAYLGLGTQSAEGASKLPITKNYFTYDYPGGHSEFQQGKGRAKSHFETQEAQHNIVNGTSNHIDFSAGNRFKLSKHPEESELGEYILTEVTHTAHDYSYLSGTTATSGEAQHYSNTFRCTPYMKTYRPPRITERAQAGVQTAVVVGPEGEEISTDKYGRIQVQFHWIRKDGKRKGEPCFRWVRVAQTWAGNGYGAWFLPRIGHEVVVQFLNGDPDQPMVVGSVYNSSREIPFAQPANRTQSGIKTNSSKNSRGFNALRFEDKTGTEEIYIHAEKDFNQQIKHDLTITVDNDEKQHIKHDLTITVDNDDKQHIKRDLSIEVDNNYAHETKENESHTVGKNRSENIGEHLTVHIGKTARIEATDSITLKVGSSAIQITPSKIILHSPDVVCNDEPIGG
jgi:type VI secretion system secreted protein VgrG